MRFSISFAPDLRRIRELLERDRVRHHERESETRRHLRAQLLQPLFRRQLTVARSDTNRGKGLRVFRETGFLDFLLREFSAREVTLPVIEMPAPSGVFSRGSAHEDAALSERGKVGPE